MTKKQKDKWGKKKVFLYPIDPYNKDLLVVVNGQMSDAIKKLKSFKTKTAEENIQKLEEWKANGEKYLLEDYKHNTGTAYCVTELPHGYIMMVSHQNNWIKTVEIVSHESNHVVFHVLDKAGIPLTPDSEEAYTYLQGNMLSSILREMY